MQHDECLKVLAEFHTDEIVVAAYQSAFEWTVIKPHSLTYLSIGAMGQASSHGFGLALGNPDKRVIVLDGDGSLLMNLGSLVTIAQAAPTNFIHFLLENGTYESNGSQPIPGKGIVKFLEFAKAAGYRESFEFNELEQFKDAIPGILGKTGPVFVNLKVSTGPKYPQAWDIIHSSEARESFRKALNN